jgi:hypothetical protein
MGISLWLPLRNTIVMLLLSLETLMSALVLAGRDALVVVVMVMHDGDVSGGGVFFQLLWWWWCVVLVVMVVVVLCGCGGVSIVVGDFFGRPLLLFWSIFVVASYRLSLGC